MLLYSFFFVSSSIGSLNPSVMAPLELNEGNIHEIPKFVRCKNREKICVKEKQSHKIIFT